MTKGRLSLLGAVLVAALALLYVSTPRAAAQAPGELNLSTSPLPISLVTEPGKTVTTEVRVRNSGPQEERLQVDLMKFDAFGNQGQPRLMEREEGDDYFDWVRFSTRRFTAEPNVWETVKMSIDVPTSAAFGYYYAVVFSRAGQASIDAQTGIEGGVAVLVLLEARVPGAERAVKIEEFSSTHGIYEFLPASFNAHFANTGNVHVAPVGSIFITKGEKQVEVIGFNSGRGNILPGSNRIYVAEWRNGFPVYALNEEGARSLKWDFTKVPSLRFGKYKATLVAVYDDGRRDIPVEASVTFWVIPWRLLAVLFVILGLVGVGVWSVGRKSWRKVKGRRTKSKGKKHS